MELVGTNQQPLVRIQVSWPEIAGPLWLGKNADASPLVNG